MKTNKIELTAAYKELSTKSKQIVKAKIQNEAGWSEATFYNKMTADDNLNYLEFKALYFIIKLEIADTIYFLQDYIKQIENLTNEKSK